MLGKIEREMKSGAIMGPGNKKKAEHTKVSPDYVTEEKRAALERTNKLMKNVENFSALAL